jgi:hypothetical protein
MNVFHLFSGDISVTHLKDCVILGYGALYFGRKVLTFRKKLLYSSSGYKKELSGSSAMLASPMYQTTRHHILLSQIRDFPFHRLLRFAGLRWRYSTPAEWTLFYNSRRTEEKPPPPTVRVLVCSICCHGNAYLASRWLAMDYSGVQASRHTSCHGNVLRQPLPSKGRCLVKLFRLSAVVSHYVGKFLISWTFGGFSRRIQLYGVTYLLSKYCKMTYVIYTSHLVIIRMEKSRRLR